MHGLENSEILPKLFCLHYNECDPKKCSALKLKKHNLLKKISRIKGSLNKATILNPFSQREIAIIDRKNIVKYGLIVIDCSWKNVLKIKKINFDSCRRLPALIAVNPINYGKWEKLSSAEAIAAALYITGFIKFANLILSKFSWGEEFFKLNNLK